MNKPKHNGLSKIIIALLATMLIACMLLALAACDNNNNGNQNDKPDSSNSTGTDNNQSGGNDSGTGDNTGSGGTGSDGGGNQGGTGTDIGNSGENSDDNSSEDKISVSLNTLDSEQLNQALNGILGYLYAYAGDYKYAEMMGDYVTDNENGLSMFLTISLIDNDDNEIFCCFSFFKSEQEANQSFDSMANRDELIFKNKSVIIEESEKGFYNSIINTPLPQDTTVKAQLKFYCTALKNVLNDDCKQSSFVCDGACDALYIAGMSKQQGNIYNIYDCCNAEYFAENRDWGNFDLSLYTDDSYIKETDGIYYVYLQNKPGFVFVETKDGTGYIVDEFYYNGEVPEHVIIPASYNGKPVVEIYTDIIPIKTTILTIPTSITTLWGYVLRYAEGLRIIYYEGTMAQWNAFGIGEYDIEHIEVIHCSDGDIILNQD